MNPSQCFSEKSLFKKNNMEFLDIFCKECGKFFTKTKNLQVHISEQHSETIEKYECPLCQYRSTRMTNIRKHFRESHGKTKKMEKILQDYEEFPKTVVENNESMHLIYLL